MASKEDGEQSIDDPIRQIMMDVMQGKVLDGTSLSIPRLQHFDNVQSLLTLAHLAVEKNRAGVLHQIMPFLAREDVYNEEQLTVLLHKAVRRNQLDIVETIIINGGDVNATLNGKPLLHIACQEGNMNIINVILGAGANIDATDKKGDTVLHVVLNTPAIQQNKDSIVAALIRQGANTNLKGSNGKYLMHTAAITSTATLTLLLQTGHDVNARDVIHADTPLHVACNMACRESILVLIRHGCHFNLLNQNGHTPLARLLRGTGDFNDFHGKSRVKLARKLVAIGFKMFAETKTILGKAKHAKGRDKAHDKYLEIVRFSSKVQSLQELSRHTVLSSLHSGRHVRTQIQSLHIPSQIMSFVLFEDLREL